MSKAKPIQTQFWPYQTHFKPNFGGYLGAASPLCLTAVEFTRTGPASEPAMWDTQNVGQNPLRFCHRFLRSHGQSSSTKLPFVR